MKDIECKLLVIGAGPIGDMAARIAMHRGHRVIVVDRIPERLERVAARGPVPDRRPAVRCGRAPVVRRARRVTCRPP